MEKKKALSKGTKFTVTLALQEGEPLVEIVYGEAFDIDGSGYLWIVNNIGMESEDTIACFKKWEYFVKG